MLSSEDNELLCRSGRGTPMGDLLRQYWLPALPSREDCGIRCVYHGWKFDVSGRCVDMPSEPIESTFKDKVRARAYPCHEVNGVIWAYMGPRQTPPPFPPFEITTLPADHVYPPLMMLEECNWVQALEGDIDSAHIDWVHGKVRADSTQRGTWHRDKRPKLDVLTTDYGACYSARRQSDVEGHLWHRITQFIAPNIHTDYLRSRELARELMLGIPFLVNLQDRAMTETMGPIYDRTQEHLGTTDAMVIFVRRRLLEAARALREHGTVPANVDDPSLYRIRPASILLPEGESWVAATEKARQSDAGVPIAWVPFV